MKDVKIIILEVQEKLASNGKTCWRFKTNSDEGVKWYTCFDAKVSAFLKGIVGKDKIVDAKVEDNLIKWTEFVSHGAPVEEISMAEQMVSKQVQKILDKNIKFAEETLPVVDKKQVSMYVSYAKDIFIELNKNPGGAHYDALMETAVNLVKRAREAFEK